MRCREISAAFAHKQGSEGDALEYEVVSCPVDAIPRTFIEEHHYSGSYPAARERFLLYRHSKLVGAAVFSHPPNAAVLKRLPCERMAGIELGRLVLLDSPAGRPDEGVPGNGASWFVARRFELLRNCARRGSPSSFRAAILCRA